MRALPSSKWLLLLLFLIVSGIVPAHAQDVIITGTVVNYFDGPVAGAIVHLKGKGLYDTTASNGNFVLTDITEIRNPNNPSLAAPPSLHNNILSLTTVKTQQKVSLRNFTIVIFLVFAMVTFKKNRLRTLKKYVL